MSFKGNLAKKSMQMTRKYVKENFPHIYADFEKSKYNLPKTMGNSFIDNLRDFFDHHGIVVHIITTHKGRLTHNYQIKREDPVDYIGEFKTVKSALIHALHQLMDEIEEDINFKSGTFERFLIAGYRHN